MQVGADQMASRAYASARALAALRAAWRCDCDGESHRGGTRPLGGPAATVERHLDVIQSVTGRRPPTCPWRAFYDELVDKALDLSVDADGGYIMATLDADAPPLLTDSLRIFRIARAAGDRHVRRHLERKNNPRPPSSPRPSTRPGFVSMRRRRKRRG